MKETRIRWAGSTWNPMTGCTEVSPGCKHCYAKIIAERFRGPAFPIGFEPMFRPDKLDLPRRWTEPRRIFVNSMSDVHHAAFTRDQIDAVYGVMRDVPRHDYLVLTKRPGRMLRYIEHSPRFPVGYVPDHIWLGTSIESDQFTGRARILRMIPAVVRFLSCEPLLGPLPSLDLDGIRWVIVGGESGAGYRPMLHEWAREIRDRCVDAGVAFYFKQSAGPRPETGVELDGRIWEQYPLPHPALSHPERRRQVGVFVDGDSAADRATATARRPPAQAGATP